jgi:hypothetical protein
MKPEDELALKVTKEIVIKFIEVGKVSVTSFDDAFRQIHGTVRSSLRETPPPAKGQSKS